MMYKGLVLMAVTSMAFAGLTELVMQSAWKEYKAKHNKSYTLGEDQLRFNLFLERYDMVTKHNTRFAQGLETYTMAMNYIADWTMEEILGRNGLRSDPNRSTENDVTLNVEAPASIDWRNHNGKSYVTGVKDQGQCGSCWSFGTTGVLEGQLMASTGKLVSLSESNLVDCDNKDAACNGGLQTTAYSYVESKGLDTEAAYPYKPKKESCKYNANGVAVHMNGFTVVTKGSESALQSAVGSVGPVTVGIDASHMSFQLYENGVYKEPNCSSRNLDHAVLVVGYDTDSTGQKYWIVKNSWNTSWGQKGYIWMARDDNNMCGIATDASYPHNVKS